MLPHARARDAAGGRCPLAPDRRGRRGGVVGRGPRRGRGERAARTSRATGSPSRTRCTPPPSTARRRAGGGARCTAAWRSYVDRPRGARAPPRARRRAGRRARGARARGRGGRGAGARRVGDRRRPARAGAGAYALQARGRRAGARDARRRAPHPRRRPPAGARAARGDPRGHAARADPQRRAAAARRGPLQRAGLRRHRAAARGGARGRRRPGARGRDRARPHATSRCNHNGNVPAADAHADRALALAEGADDPTLLAQALAGRAMVDFLLGHGVDWAMVEPCGRARGRGSRGAAVPAAELDLRLPEAVDRPLRRGPRGAGRAAAGGVRVGRRERHRLPAVLGRGAGDRRRRPRRGGRAGR